MAREGPAAVGDGGGTAPALLALAACAGAFALGSIPFGLWVARASGGVDPRTRGSGNIGATNVSRVLGFWPWGFATFALDFGKGLLPALAVRSGWVAGAWDIGGAGLASRDPLAWAPGLCAVLGHCYSPWLGFKGGKGVATGLGALAVLSPLAALFGALAFWLAFAATKTGSLSSLSGLLAGAVSHVLLAPVGTYLWIGGALALVILVRHESNLDALLQDREQKFG
jgi:glycerol-3-phosphate acyltransferase PlsY